MASRLKLQSELEELLGSRNVYFQPPESKKLQYDCIVYHRSKIDTRKADNRSYTMLDRYDLTLIYRNPDSELPKKILEHFQYCSHTSFFTVDNLNHDVFTLYY